MRNGTEVKLREGTRRVEVRIPAGVYSAAQAIATEVGLSIQGVISMALASYVRNWTSPLARKGKQGQVNTSPWPSGWLRSSPCPLPAQYCNVAEPHDPASHLGARGDYLDDLLRSAFKQAGLSL